MNKKNTETITDKTELILYSLVSSLRNTQNDKNVYVCTMLLLYLLIKSDINVDYTYSDILSGKIDKDETVVNAAKQYITEDIWNDFRDLRTRYSKENLIEALLSDKTNYLTRYEDFTTPESLINLSLKLLKIKGRVADICCGTGNFLVAAAKSEKAGSLSGYEIDTNSWLIAYLRKKIVGENMQIVLGDVFSILNTNDKFDVIFSEYPWHLHSYTDVMEKYWAYLSNTYFFSKKASSDWLFNLLIVNLLSETGKAVAIMPSGNMVNQSDLEIRKYFAENEYIETIIQLPPKMHSYTAIRTCLVVFSHKNKSTHFVDASATFKKGRRLNEFTEENITSIIQAVKKDSEISCTANREEIKEKDYSLDPARYLAKPLEYSNSVLFKSIIKKISRGAPITAAKLDEITSGKKTPFRYLSVANMTDGLISDDLLYLTNIEPSLEKYCVKNNSLVMSKFSYPYKIVVAKVSAGTKLLMNSNLYLIELDESKANPYYVKSFLESEDGDASLKLITAGTALASLGVSDLLGIVVPLPSLEVQNRIAEKYIEKENTVKELKKKLASAISDLSQVFKSEDISKC
ncbi:MAG: N-6 DNA methylase [Treponema sp.]